MSHLKRLVGTTVISALAFFLAGIVGILLVPIIVSAYGIVGLGLLSLGRTLMPTGLLAMLDLGVSETATISIGQARATHNWQRAGQQVGLLLFASSAVGAIAGVGLIAIAPHLVRWIGIDHALTQGAISMLQVTGACLPILFPCLVLEGVVKGFERFHLLRICEIATTLAYAAAVLMIASNMIDLQWVHYAFLTSVLLKYAMMMVSLCRIPDVRHLRMAKWSAVVYEEIKQRTRLFIGNKVLGTVQTQSPPLLIAVLVGPAGAGIYEILTRLPRFIKPVMAIMASAVLPMAARLEGDGDARRLGMIGDGCFWLVPAVVYGPLLALMGFGPEILSAWVGETYAHYWPWFAAAVSVPLIMVIGQFGFAALQSRLPVMRRSNQISAYATVLQICLSLLLIKVFEERAFIIGQVIATALVAPLSIRLLARAFDLAIQTAILPPLKFLGLAVALLPLTRLEGGLVPGWHFVESAVLYAVWCGLYWGIGYAFLLTGNQKQVVMRILRLLVHGNDARTKA